MAETLLSFQAHVAGPDGTPYEARACGSPLSTGNWQGWIEFIPVRGGEPLRTPWETTQPNRADAIYWASGLSSVYLEGALERALSSHRIRPARLPPQPAVFDGPAPTSVSTADLNTTSVLDPFSVYEKGEALLRRQLAALSAWHLVNIIRDYELSDEDPIVLNRMPAANLIDLIVAKVGTRAGAIGARSRRR
jgi:hypothetical protein